MRSVATDFLDMFLVSCAPGVHEFKVVFGDERSVRYTTVTRREVWPHTFLDQNFLQVWRMVEAWLVGREAFLTVRSVPETVGAMPVEEVRCWVLTPVGAIPYAAAEAAAVHDADGTLTVWDLDRNREERFMDAWDGDLRFPLMF